MKYPHTVWVNKIRAEKNRDEFFAWLSNSKPKAGYDHPEYKNIPSVVFFSDEEEAVAFKLIWG